MFDLIKQSYLISRAPHPARRVADVEGLPPESEKKVAFFTRQYVDALAPSNFLMTNPQVLRETVSSGGQNLVRGLNNLLVGPREGRRQAAHLDDRRERVPARAQRRHHAGQGGVPDRADAADPVPPLTEQVYKRPLVIIPPWINKYYILDLREKNSFIRWAVARATRCS